MQRLEKGNARMETKVKMGGMENGQVLDGDRSAIRLKSNKDLSFIFYSRVTKKNPATSSAMADSLMRSMGLTANGFVPNPAMPKQAGEIAELYSVKCVKGKRCITLQSEGSDPQAANGIIQSAPNMMQAGKGGLAMGAATIGIGVGMKLLGKAKKESIKYPINIRKLREDFFEITLDKNLPKGEYAFVLGENTGMDSSSTLFAFAIE